MNLKMKRKYYNYKCTFCGRVTWLGLYDYVIMKKLGLSYEDFICKKCQNKLFEILGKNFIEKLQKILKL